MANPNIVNVTSILGKTAVLAVTTTPTDIVSNGSGSNAVVKINNLLVSNVNGTVSGDITASLFRGGVQYKVAHTITVPADATLVVLEKGTAVYLEEGDSIRLTSSVDLVLQAVCSYEVIS
jgi:Na+-translocating ferredoxin:NAD+ oxidoreductase RnfE subunit